MPEAAERFHHDAQSREYCIIQCGRGPAEHVQEVCDELRPQIEQLLASVGAHLLNGRAHPVRVISSDFGEMDDDGRAELVVSMVVSGAVETDELRPIANQIMVLLKGKMGSLLSLGGAVSVRLDWLSASVRAPDDAVEVRASNRQIIPPLSSYDW